MHEHEDMYKLFFTGLLLFAFGLAGACALALTEPQSQKSCDHACELRAYRSIGEPPQ
jgi:hypothetical protein